MCPYCGFCKHAKNRREWNEKIYWGDDRYDIIYQEEITCELNGSKWHPMQLGCDGKNFKKL